MQSVERSFIYFVISACAVVINNVYASECHVNAMKHRKIEYKKKIREDIQWSNHGVSSLKFIEFI